MAGEVKVDLGGVSLECEYDQNTLSELMICAFKNNSHILVHVFRGVALEFMVHLNSMVQSVEQSCSALEKRVRGCSPIPASSTSSNNLTPFY